MNTTLRRGELKKEKGIAFLRRGFVFVVGKRGRRGIIRKKKRDADILLKEEQFSIILGEGTVLGGVVVLYWKQEEVVPATRLQNLSRGGGS